MLSEVERARSNRPRFSPLRFPFPPAQLPAPAGSPFVVASTRAARHFSPAWQHRAAIPTGRDSPSGRRNHRPQREGSALGSRWGAGQPPHPAQRCPTVRTQEWRGRRGRGRRRHPPVQQRQEAFPLVLRRPTQPAVVAHALETRRQDGLQETPQELHCRQRQLVPLMVLAVLIAEGDFSVFVGENAVVAQGRAIQKRR